MNLKDKTVVIDNKTYCYSKIVMLSSNKGFSCEKFNGLKLINNYICSCEYLYGYLTDIKHLYFLSSDKICEGDWYYNVIKNKIMKCESELESHSLNHFIGVECNKVIASTDPSLNLPKPSNSFLQVYIDAYNKGEKIEECLVEYEEYWINSKGIKGNTFIETALFEESINDYDAIFINNPKATKGEITIRKVKDSWSREEVEQLCRKAYREGAAYSIGSHDNFKQIHLTENEWISENL